MNQTLRIFGGLILLCLLAVPLAQAQPLHSEGIVSTPPTRLSPTDAAKQLNDFRLGRLDGDFCLQFELLHRPKRGAETRYAGIAWGTWQKQGDNQFPVTRFQITESAPADKAAKPQVWEWLLQSGPSPHIWVLAPGALAPSEVASDQWRKPLFPGTIYSPFDLLAPFVYWPDFDYTGTDRILGLGVDVFTMKPPAADRAAGFGPVRISINREFPALVRAESLDAKGGLLRKLDLGDFAKVQEQYMIKFCDLLDTKTQDYDRFQVKATALKLQLDAAIFDPAKLNQPAPLPATAAWAPM